MVNKVQTRFEIPKAHLQVLLALDTHLTTLNGNGVFSIKSVNELTKYGCRPSIVRGALAWLSERQILKVTTRGDVIDSYYNAFYEFTPLGAEIVHESLNDQSTNSSSAQPSTIHVPRTPASDRFVSVDHNSLEVTEAQQSLDDLNNAVKSANDLPFDSDERHAILVEIGSLRNAVSQPRIRLDVIWSAIRASGPIKWLAEQVISSAVRMAAQKALEKLSAWLGLFT